MRTHANESSGGGSPSAIQSVPATSRAKKRWAPRLPSFHSLSSLLAELSREVPVPDPAESSDESLLLAVQGGDRAALARLYARYAPPLRAVAMRLVKDRAKAEDLLHDVFCEAWQCAASYEPARARVRTWLLIRLRSRAIDLLRRASCRRGSAVRLRRASPADPGSTDRPESRYLALVVSRGMNELASREYKLLDLVYFQDLSLVDAAAELGLPLGTVKSRLHRLLGRLAEVRSRAPGSARWRHGALA